MGLSSKKVSSSNTGLDWNQSLLQSQNLEIPKPNNNHPPMTKQQPPQQNQQQNSEPVNCPRCDSTNTKFCYYNNYNKSQPRHFCRSCKRHWTKGGTLRNVPVGGGRKKHKIRPKKPKTTTTETAATTSNGNMEMEEAVPSLLYPASSLLLPQQNLVSARDSESGGGIFMSSSSNSMNLHQNQNLIYPFSTSSTFGENPCSVLASNVYSYGGEEFKSMEEPNNNKSIIPSTSVSTNTELWDIPAATTSVGMEMSNYWGWEDLDSLVSTDLNVPWDDSDIKP